MRPQAHPARPLSRLWAALLVLAFVAAAALTAAVLWIGLVALLTLGTQLQELRP